MKREPVVLSPEVRPIVRDAMVASLERHGIEVVAIAVASRHFHLLARFVDRQARKLIGIAKKDAARIASDHGLAPPGGLWAKRSKADPIRNRGHQINTVWYILDHVDQGGAIWAPERILKAHEARRARKQ